MDQKKILIVDDSSDNIYAIVSHLKELGKPYFLMQAVNGETALEIAEIEQPDVIITDWDMPKMDGIELIKKLKSNEKTKDIFIIMSTGVMITSEHLQTALDAGATDYIQKPVDKVELIARIQSILTLSESQKLLARKNQQLIEKNAELEAYDRMVSHDLKGPIGHLYTLAGFVHEDDESNISDESRSYLEQIIKSSMSCLEMIDGILNFASADKPDALEESVDMEKILGRVIESLDLQIKDLNAKVIVTHLPIVHNAVSIKVYQLFYNLLGNALKFQKPDNIPVISIYVHSDNEVVVEDNGVGFDQSNANEIFKPLVRLTNEVKFEGYGFGLGICKRIVDFHGWNIRAESEKGVGTKFIITI